MNRPAIALALLALAAPGLADGDMPAYAEKAVPCPSADAPPGLSRRCNGRCSALSDVILNT